MSLWGRIKMAANEEREKLLDHLVRYGISLEWKDLKGANMADLDYYLEPIADFIIRDRKATRQAVLDDCIRLVEGRRLADGPTISAAKLKRSMGKLASPKYKRKGLE
jgi:hypothetical protein